MHIKKGQLIEVTCIGASGAFEKKENEKKVATSDFSTRHDGILQIHSRPSILPFHKNPPSIDSIDSTISYITYRIEPVIYHKQTYSQVNHSRATNEYYLFDAMDMPVREDYEYTSVDDKLYVLILKDK